LFAKFYLRKDQKEKTGETQIIANDAIFFYLIRYFFSPQTSQNIVFKSSKISDQTQEI
jgi:hypothetical protein